MAASAELFTLVTSVHLVRLYMIMDTPKLKNQILNLMKSNTGRFKSLLVPPSSKSPSNFSMKPFIRTPTIPIGVLVHNTRMGRCCQ